MIIGSLGKVIFVVSSVYVKTINNLSISSKVKWLEHEIINQKSKLQFGGEVLDEIRFTMKLSAYRNVNPSAAVLELKNYMREGAVLRFILGNRKVGTGKYVITEMKEEHKRFSPIGTVLTIDVDISLKEYN